MVIEQMKLSDPGLVNATEACLTLLHIQALTSPDSNIQYTIITDGGNQNHTAAAVGVGIAEPAVLEEVERSSLRPDDTVR